MAISTGFPCLWSNYRTPLELTPPAEPDKTLEEGFLVDVFIQSGEEELVSNSVLMTSPSFEVASDQLAEVVLT